MTHILTTQPRTPVTATYIILGTSIAYVRLWNITSELLTNVLIISVVGGVIASLFYYIEPIQRLGNYLLGKKYENTIGKQFPMYRDVHYKETFEEPYFANARNKIYGSVHLFSAILIALICSPIPYSSIPLELLVGAGVSCVFLIGVLCVLIPKQWERIRQVHYVLVLERYHSWGEGVLPDDDPGLTVEKVKNELVAERWTSAMNLIDKAVGNFYTEVKRLYEEFARNKEKWQKAKIIRFDLEREFESGTEFKQEIEDYKKSSRFMKKWLFVLDMRVYNLYNNLERFIEFLYQKKQDLLLILSEELIILMLKAVERDISYFYDESYKPTEENINQLRRAIEQQIRNDSSIEETSIPNIAAIIDRIKKIKGLKPFFESIVEEIEEIETRLNELTINE